MSELFFETEREIPVVNSADVIIAGGGVAGICAAIASARLGVRTALIEASSCLGGNAACGMPWAAFHDGQKQIVFGIANELAMRITRYGGIEADITYADWIPVNPEIFKIVVMEMLEEANVKLLLYTSMVDTYVSDGRLEGIIIENKSGRQMISGKVFVDCTGDADVALRAGVNIRIGRSKDFKTQPMTMIFRVAGIDLGRFEKNGAYQGMIDRFDRIAEECGFENPRRGSFSGMHRIPGSKNECIFNVTRVLGLLGTTAGDLTRAEIAGRRQVKEFFFNFLKPHVPGFEDSYLSVVAANIGVRETRRIEGVYELKRDDITEYKEQPDVIGRGSYPIDIHSPDSAGTEYLETQHISGRSYAIPYSILIPEFVDGLLVAGRCVSATHEALSAIRVIPSCMVMGQGAGTAAALCVKEKVLPRKLDIELLKKNLLEADAWLG